MSDDDDSKREAPAAQAIRQALERRRADEQQAMDARAADVLRTSVQEQAAAQDLQSVRFKEILLHCAFGALTGGAYTAKVLLPQPWSQLAEMLFEGLLFIWGKAGFKPSTAVLARVIAKLEPKRLDQMLSLRPAEAGNSLYPPPAVPKAPPPAAGGAS